MVGFPLAKSFIDDIEEIIEEVSDWAKKVVDETVQLLSPDGRAFGTVHQTDEERLEEYLKIRENTSGWAAYIDSTARTIMDKLTMDNVNPDLVVSVHPYSIAVKLAYAYANEMEGIINKVNEQGSLRGLV